METGVKTSKVETIQRYQRTRAQTLRAFVRTLGHDPTGWTFRELADEWGYSYIMHGDQTPKTARQ